MSIDILAQMTTTDHEQVIFCQNKEVGLKAIIAIHNTTLGPALGGTRMWAYSSEDQALNDVLRLSRGMTYKAAISGLKLGGGKAVIIGDPKKDKRPGYFEAYGRFVHTLMGRYITAEDVGTSVADMEAVLTQTPHVVGTKQSHGGSGDPSPFTAKGVFLGLKACAKKAYGTDNLSGKKVAVQGIGNVGYNLVKLLVADGAKVSVADIDRERVDMVCKEFGATAVGDDKILSMDCDIFAPCALGGVINDQSIPNFRCQVIAGGANNQLARREHAEGLKKRGILYAPDYVINAGGLINVSLEATGGYNEQTSLKMIDQIYPNMMKLIEIAEQKNITTAEAADVWVEDLLKAEPCKRIYLPSCKLN